MGFQLDGEPVEGAEAYASNFKWPENLVLDWDHARHIDPGDIRAIERLRSDSISNFALALDGLDCRGASGTFDAGEDAVSYLIRDIKAVYDHIRPKGLEA